MSALATYAISTAPLSAAVVPINMGDGSLVSGANTLSGSGFIGAGGSGQLVSDVSTLSGTGTITRYAVGDLISLQSTLSGVGNRGIFGEGILISAASLLDGAGELSVIGIGSLISQQSQLSGTLIRTISGTGDLVSGDHSLFGSDRETSFPTLQAYLNQYLGLVGQVDDRFNQWLAAKGYADALHNYDLFDSYLYDNGYLNESLWDKYKAATKDGWLWKQ